MKPKFNLILIFSFFALLTLSSCQQEAVEITQNEELVLSPNSAVASLMRSTSSNDGSVDDIMDEANCFSVNLPVTIIANGITITIDTLEDLELLEEIFNEFNDDDDIVEFLFPITIIFNDHTEMIIENAEQLQSFIAECTNQDDVIECVDFVYPISFSIFNTEFDLIDTVVIHNDRELYHFLERLGDQSDPIIASLNYPVSLKYSDGTVIEVHSNQELEAAISAAEELCIDDSCDAEHVRLFLKECRWEIAAVNSTDVVPDYDFYFGADGALQVKNIETNEIAHGVWNVSVTDQGLLLTISELTGFASDFNGEWLIVECAEGRFELVRETNALSLMVIERRCENEIDCSAQEVYHNLVECVWYSGTNVDAVDFNGPYNFREDGTVTVRTANGAEVVGEWHVELTDMGVYLIITLPEPSDVLPSEWLIIECSPDRIKGVNGDRYLVLERDCSGQYDCPDLQLNVGDQCENNLGELGVINENCECIVETNPFECFDHTTYIVCDDDVLDGFTEFNLELVYPNCNLDHVELKFYASVADAETNANALPFTYVNTSNPQTIYAKVTLAGTTESQLFEVQLKVENCNTSGCTEQEVDAFLMECHWIPANMNNSTDFVNYDFFFNANQELVIEGNGTTLNGVWSTSGNPTDGVYVIISQLDGDFQIFNNEWLVVECSAEVMHLKNGDNDLIIERECI